MTEFAAPIAEQIWDQKYRFKQADGTPIDRDVRDTWSRIANALAEAEKPEDRAEWGLKFYDALKGFKFLPAGRITAGAGTGRNVTLFNCLDGATPILTAEYGLVPIGDVAGEIVTVLDGYGNWTAAPVLEHGQQPVASVLLRGGYNGRELRSIKATAGHRWLLEGAVEKTTNQLVAGDVLLRVKRNDVTDNAAYRAGVRHGIVYGDGSQTKESNALIRLCGDKGVFADFFEGSGHLWNRVSDIDGDATFYLPRHVQARCLKELPKDVHASYLTGFLRGWMATDGCVNRGQAMISCGLEEAKWLRKYGAVAGMEVSCACKLPDETNYGKRKKDIYNVHFHRCTMIPEDFLLPKHKEAFETADYVWKVAEVGEFSEPVPVFCPSVPTTGSMQLDMGIHTGNCFVMGTIPDSMAGIFDMLREAALTMQQGGGIGYDFSTLRPKGALVKGVAADASGPLSFMDVWDSMCRTIMSAGSRRGAMMATMRCDHPDIEAFIEAKRDAAKLRMFNLSVLVTDAFMEAVKTDADWRLHFENRAGETLLEKTIRARDLWDKIMLSTYAQAEPGVIFIDRINALNPLNYIENIASTNPCGEQPLPPYGACLLGSINLPTMIKDAFTDNARIDGDVLTDVVRTAVRMMDNVVDVSNFPLPQQQGEAKAKRRIGLGVTGLADALIMVGLTYGSAEAVIWTDAVMKTIASTAYLASADLAEEKGCFPAFDVQEYLNHPYVQQFDQEVQDAIATKGLRNSHLTSIAPTGTISLYAGNVSSGIEPVFAYTYTRKVLEKDGSKREETVEDYAYRAWLDYMAECHPDLLAHTGDLGLPDYFVSAQTLPPEAHVKMQAAAQKWVDSSISKTVNVPEDIPFEHFKAVYQMAYDMGCKGCTTYRPNAVTGSILSVTPEHTKAKDGSWSISAEGVMQADKSPKMDDLKQDEAFLQDLQSAVAQGNMPHLMPGEQIKAAPTLAERPEKLQGETYKIKWPGSAHAIYVTINDDEQGKPFEIFINSKDTEHFAWTVALTRMISAVFRRGGDVGFVADELEQVFDPRGGAWMGGKFVTSPIAAIGGVIRQHMEPKKDTRPPHPQQAGFLLIMPKGKVMTETEAKEGADEHLDLPLWGEAGSTPIGRHECADCGSFNTKKESGCFTCKDCGSSKCG